MLLFLVIIPFSGSAKILIIEDSHVDRVLLMRLLQKEGFTNLIAAERGEDGLNLYKSQNPDIVVVDIILPDMKGFDVCRQIKSTKGNKAKVILVKGNIDGVDNAAAEKCQADKFLTKTQEFRDIIDSISSFC